MRFVISGCDLAQGQNNVA